MKFHQHVWNFQAPLLNSGRNDNQDFFSIDLTIP
ncbi:hypothetical protein MHK_007063 [Candidatus Magnetomorum sp. HK-1]|nr:hypothetical protein MHK_007063 [Candidatus Magnetomorum sp. HK-1]